MRSERSSREQQAHRNEKIFNNPSVAPAVACLLSGLLHGGGVLALEHKKDLRDGAETAVSSAAASIDDLLLRIRLAKQEARLQEADARIEVDPTMLDMLKEGQPPAIDLSETYFSTEALIGEYADEEIVEAKNRYEKIIAEAKALRDQKRSESEVMGAVLKEQGAYDAHDAFLIDLLLENKGNCEARMKLMTAAAQDLYPEWTDSHSLFVQNFPSWRDVDGVVQPGHARAVVELGAELLVLEGAQPSVIARPSDVQLLDAQWLAMTGLLVKQGAVTYEELGFASVTPLPGDSFQSSSIMRFPQSHAQPYQGSANHDVGAVRDEDGTTARENIQPSAFLGEISDQQIEKHDAERELAVDAERDAMLAEFTQWKGELEAKKGIRLGLLLEMRRSSIEIYKSTESTPLSDDALRTYLQFADKIYGFNSLSLSLRPDQHLPPHLYSILGGRQVFVTYIPEPTSENIQDVLKINSAQLSYNQFTGLTSLPAVFRTPIQYDSVSPQREYDPLVMRINFNTEQPAQRGRSDFSWNNVQNYDAQEFFDEKYIVVSFHFNQADTLPTGALNGTKITAVFLGGRLDDETLVQKIEDHAMVGAQIGIIRIYAAKNINIDPQAFSGAEIGELIISPAKGELGEQWQQFEGVKKVTVIAR